MIVSHDIQISVFLMNNAFFANFKRLEKQKWRHTNIIIAAPEAVAVWWSLSDSNLRFKIPSGRTKPFWTHETLELHVLTHFNNWKKKSKFTSIHLKLKCIISSFYLFRWKLISFSFIVIWFFQIPVFFVGKPGWSLKNYCLSIFPFLWNNLNNLKGCNVCRFSFGKGG